MIKEAIKEAETIEEAKALALAELGVNEDKAQFEVLVQPEKKKFGLFGGSLAKVRVFYEETPTDIATKKLLPRVYIQHNISVFAEEFR